MQRSGSNELQDFNHLRGLKAAEGQSESRSYGLLKLKVMCFLEK